jgi:prenyltransferase beta subunit
MPAPLHPLLPSSTRACVAQPAAPPPALADVLRLLDDSGRPFLMRQAHVEYALRTFTAPLSSGFTSMDTNRTWMTYWALQALDLLDCRPARHFAAATDFLASCQALMQGPVGPYGAGGIAGGPLQGGHTASTYGAVLGLCVIGTRAALGAVQRAPLYRFLLSCKDAATGGFRVQPEGELDSRSTYTALVVADLLNMATPQVTAGAADFLLACQTHEGGFSGEPGGEAHGAYTFCAVAGLYLLGQLHRADLPALARWLAARQMSLEGGFNGRTQKLVDGCYSHFVGATAALVRVTADGGCAPRDAAAPPPPWADGGAEADEAVPLDSWDGDHAARAVAPAPASRRVVAGEGGSGSGGGGGVGTADSPAAAEGGNLPASFPTSPPALGRRVTLGIGPDGLGLPAARVHGLFARVASSGAAARYGVGGRSAPDGGKHKHSRKRPRPAAATAPSIDGATADADERMAEGSRTEEEGEDEDDDDDVVWVALSPRHRTLGATPGLSDDVVYNRLKLQRYLLYACQQLEGGLRDKPGASRDLYHTCYCLAGLSLAQHDSYGRYDPAWVLGATPNNLVAPIHPAYCLRYERVAAAKAFFAAAPLSHADA